MKKDHRIHKTKTVGTKTQSTVGNFGVWLFIIAEKQNLPFDIQEFFYNS